MFPTDRDLTGETCETSEIGGVHSHACIINSHACLCPINTSRQPLSLHHPSRNRHYGPLRAFRRVCSNSVFFVWLPGEQLA